MQPKSPINETLLIGNAWLQAYYGLYTYHLTHTAVFGSRAKKEVDENGDVSETYPPHYAPGNTPMDHVEFSLKYDDLSLDFLRNVFGHISPKEVAEYIQLKPKGTYERKVGYLYEFLTGLRLPIPDQGKGNYIDLLDDAKYVTGKTIKNSRWNINDNLIGNREFCPIIRKTPALQAILQEDYKTLVEKVTQSFPPDIFHRAVNYLYTKETRSSYQIEKEKPSPERVTRFIRLLEKAGEQSVKDLLSENNLTALQNEIVDPRYSAKHYRDFQNYIGQTTFNYKQIIHYVCPPSAYVSSLMNGLSDTAGKMEGISPVARAAIIAFSFVFIHPFEDGNGRLHRFLIHDMLTRDKVVPKGMIIPVSAHMVNHIKEYDTALEMYSMPLMKKIHYDLKDDQSLIVMNPDEVEAYFRYPDLTSQSIYLGKTIKATITEDIFWEMEFLVKYDEVKTTIRDIVDMPDTQLDLFIKFLHQNRGIFPARRRKQFEKLTDDEIAKMQSAFQEIFNIPFKI